MIQINENFEKAYKDSMAKGFSIRELLTIGAAVCLLSGICFVCYFLLGWNLYISFFLGLVPAGLVVVSGFWRSASDLDIKEYIEARKQRKETELLLWKCSEYDEEKSLYDEILAAVNEEMEGKGR